jgi:hypothetical protein
VRGIPDLREMQRFIQAGRLAAGGSHDGVLALGAPLVEGCQIRKSGRPSAPGSQQVTQKEGDPGGQEMYTEGSDRIGVLGVWPS